jgi:hypothetical protein
MLVGRFSKAEDKNGLCGSTNANGNDPKSCLGRVFHFKIGRFVVQKDVHSANARPYLKLKTRPRFFLHSFSLSMSIEKHWTCTEQVKASAFH